MKKSLLTIPVLLPFTGHAHAAQTEAAADTLRLGEVQVLQVSKANVPLLPLEVTTVTRAEIERSTESTVLPVLQTRVPGMFVTERGMGGFGVSRGSAGDISIRGIGGLGRVLVMIDGQPQWAGVFGHILPDTYATSEIEKVEVVSGPSSILYGSNAMGGSINIITRRADTEGFSGSFRAMAGSYLTQKYALNLGYRNNRLNAYAAAQYESSDGHRPNSSYWTANQYGSVSYRLSDHWDTGTNFTITETLGRNPGPEYEPVFDARIRMLRASTFVFLNNSYAVSTGGVRLYWNGGRHRINDGHVAAETAPDYLFRSTDYNYGLTLFQTIKPWSGADLSAGFDFKRWGGHTWYDYFSGDTEKEVDRAVNQYAGYALVQQSFLGNRLSLNAGLRVEHSSQFGNELIPQAGFIVRPCSSNTIKFSFGKGYRAPSIRELYIRYSPKGGPNNPDLKPERLLNYELQIRQRLLNDRLEMGVGVFLIDAKDLIDMRFNPATGSMLLVNVDKTVNKGVEATLDWAVADHWSLAANYAYLHTQALITTSPCNKLSAQLRFHPSRWDLSLESMSIWGLRLSEQNVRNYSLLNARVAYSFGKYMGVEPRLFCRLDNITDATYQTMEGYTMPGFTFLAGLDLHF